MSAPLNRDRLELVLDAAAGVRNGCRPMLMRTVHVRSERVQ